MVNELTKLSNSGKIYWFGTYIYTAFGNQIESTDTENPFRYCGEYYDSETGLTYLRNRYYNSASGRFINEDPIKDGLNWYVYCNSNPVMNVDPSGMEEGQLYDTIDDAATAAAEELLNKMYEQDKEKEYCAIIDTKHHKFYYKYRENKSKTPDIEFYIRPFGSPKAVIHTHPYNNVYNDNDRFSTPNDKASITADTELSNRKNVIYVATPVGNLRKYIPNSGNDAKGILISDKLPIDPKYTAYQKIKNTLFWKIVTSKFPEIDEMDIVKAHLKYPNDLHEIAKEIGIINTNKKEDK